METAKELKDWFVGERIKRTLAALEKNGGPKNFVLLII